MQANSRTVVAVAPGRTIHPQDGSRARARAAFLLAVLAAGLVAVSPVSRAMSPVGGRTASVIVRAASAASVDVAERAVRDLGGRVTSEIHIIDAFAAAVPESAIRALGSALGVAEVTRDAHLQLNSIGAYDPTADANSLYSTTQAVGGQGLWASGATGKGVDVALIDSGVVPVDGLTAAGKVINGPDLSFDSQVPQLRYLDGYGHGTHLAGIIAGRDDAAVPGTYVGDTSNFIGMAPDARILSVKVADHNGIADVSQVIAAIDWVVQHRHDHDMNVRVLNLSFGTDSNQPYVLDPLALAAEVAWHSGIAVVASAGNFGPASKSLTDPAYDPYVIAVGAADTNGTVTQADDTVASFSSWGDGVRNPDLVAPGVHVASLRDPGSYVDTNYGVTAAVGTRFFRGSGTSQATAVVSGAAALLFSRHPHATPDEIKAALTGSAVSLQNQGGRAQGAGELQLANAAVSDDALPQIYPRALGTGTLERSRGSFHLVSNGVVLSGEQDIFGHAFDSDEMAEKTLERRTWTAGRWNGSTWAGSSWTGSSWSGSSWSGSSWSGSSWGGSSWGGSGWSDSNWSGRSWGGASWAGSSWGGSSWGGSSWGGSSWGGSSWG